MDIGGTKLLSALFKNGRMLERTVEVPTPVSLEPEQFVAALAGVLRDTAAANGVQPGQISGLGLGVPSTVDYSRGLLDGSPNLPAIAAYPLAQKLATLLGIPVTMENDANCFALGEATFGVGAGRKSCAGITLGTGLGVGVVLGGRLLRGAHGCAGEIWHAPYGAGILEDRVSGTALERQYELLSGKQLNGGEIYRRAAEGDPLACEAFDEFGAVLGHGLAWLINLLDPEVVVVGGSVARAWELFERPMRQAVHRYQIGRNRTEIVRSKLCGQAVLYGALAVFQDKNKT